MKDGSRKLRLERPVILADGAFEMERAKTAVGIIRYGRCRVAAVIDADNAGRTAFDVIGVGKDIPIVASLEESLAYDPDSIVIGIAPKGGVLPVGWRCVILRALEAKLDVVSGLHTFLNEDQEIAKAAEVNQCIIEDVRRPPAGLPVGDGRCAKLRTNTVLTVGTDCCVGKMTVALELTKAALSRGLRADFVATGQTGIMIWGKGVSVDAVVADFIAGAAEQMVVEASQNADWVFIEGQGSLYHPGYSGVTMGLIHGSSPKQLILCHQPSRKSIRQYDIDIPALSEAVRYHEEVLKPLFPTRVSAVALNTWGVPDDTAARIIEAARSETGLPVDDCIRFGPNLLLDALIEAGDRTY